MNEDVQMELELIESLKRLIRSSYLYGKQAHDAVFNEDEGELAGVAYLQRASSKMASAEALYYSNYEILAHNEAENIFEKYDEFADELIEDFATKHSHQWTDLQFDELSEAFDNSAFAFESK